MQPTSARLLAGGWLAALWGGAAALAAQAPDEPVATWRGEPRTLPFLGEQASLGAGALEAVRTWAPWTAARGYRLVLSETGRVLLALSPTYERRAGGKKEDNTVERFLESVERTIAEVDRLIPPPENGAPSKTVVVAGVRQDDYPGMVAAVAAQNAALGAWAEAAAHTRSGFVLAEPLVGVWLEDPPQTEEWNPESELVHRVACELVLCHAALLPAWLQLGLTWHVEERVMRSIYCFPYHTGFVSIYDHTDWHTALMQMFKTRKRSPFELDEAAVWNPREGFDKTRAYLAFGVARYLADHGPQSIAPLLRDLDAQITEKRKVPTGEHTWNTDPDYRLPVSDQLAAIERHAGEDFLEQTTLFFMKGKRYRAPREGREK